MLQKCNDGLGEAKICSWTRTKGSRRGEAAKQREPRKKKKSAENCPKTSTKKGGGARKTLPIGEKTPAREKNRLILFWKKKSKKRGGRLENKNLWRRGDSFQCINTTRVKATVEADRALAAADRRKTECPNQGRRNRVSKNPKQSGGIMEREGNLPRAPGLRRQRDQKAGAKQNGGTSSSNSSKKKKKHLETRFVQKKSKTKNGI